ncbi:MAG: hypothetical protein E7329_07665 [Clostridiales bacterium]|nr:hypothetical protein [Clostridiales bacterium]
MPTYQELISKYQKRRKEHLADTVSAGLSYADNLAVDLGILEDSGILDTVSTALPFALIAVTEQLQVILGKKTATAGASDAVQRMIKTGAAMSVGALASAVGGPVAAVPAAMASRALLDHYKSRSLLNLRIQERINRLRALRMERGNQSNMQDERPALPPGITYLAE